MHTSDRLHTGAELAALLRCSERTVARLVIDGMPSILVRGCRVNSAKAQAGILANEKSSVLKRPMPDEPALF